MKTKFLIVMLCIAFLSCNKKQDDFSSSNNSNNSHVKFKTADGFEFDELGEVHNDALVYVGNHTDLLELTAQERFEYSNTYTDDYSSNNLSWAALYDELSISKEAADASLTSDTDPFEILNNEDLLQTNMEDFTDRLSGIFNDAYNESNGTIISSSAFTSLIEDLEDYVVNNYTVSYNSTTQRGNAAACMLATCAVAKYSYNFWYAALNDQYNNWYPILQEGSNPAARSIKAAAADAYAFIFKGWIDTDGNGTRETWDSGYAVEVARAWSASA
ncbi:MAG TPA: hypothetical protein PL009_09580 [Flavipsychrobacter sp.]|nr:hypothetical protein [Flavipsychrobacter sp.]